MAEFSFGDLLAAAAEAPQTSFGPELDAPGRYRAEVAASNSKISSKGKLQFGIKFKVVGGPKDGHAIWSNQTLSPESPAALDIFFRTFEALGIPRDAWAKYGSNLEAAGEAAANAIIGAPAEINVQMGKPNNGYAAKLEVKFINPPKATQTAPVAAAAGAVPPAPQIPAQAAPPVVPPAAPAAAPIAPPRSPF